MVTHAFNPRILEEKAGRYLFMGLWPAWSMEQVPGQPGLLHRETLFQKTKQKQRNKNF